VVLISFAEVPRMVAHPEEFRTDPASAAAPRPSIKQAPTWQKSPLILVPSGAAVWGLLMTFQSLSLYVDPIFESAPIYLGSPNETRYDCHR